MAVNLTETHFKDPLYQSALQHLQMGEWEEGLVQLDKLILRYPLEQALRSLRQEMNLRANMDRTEHVDQSKQRRQQLGRMIRRSWIIIMALGVLFVGYRSISSFVEERVTVARQVMAREVEFVEQAVMLSDAEALLLADRPEEALVLLEEVQSSGAEFPDLENLMVEARVATQLSATYAEAKILIERQDWSAAHRTLQGILEEDPTFRDVSILLADLNQRTQVYKAMDTADTHFLAGEWIQAIEGYEGIRSLDPTFEVVEIADRMFTSYVNAANSFLVDQADSLIALESAEIYFRKALSMRPQDPAVKAQRELAYLYLKAQNDYDQGLWSEVINGLEIVNAEDEGYALGTARQTLYEAYSSRGDVWMEKGEFELATADYQRATVLAEQDPDAVLRLYEAHLKIAEVLGAQNNYEGAVFHYSSAVEISDLKARALQNNPVQVADINEAEGFANAGNYSVAYEEYRMALGIIPGNACLSFGTYQETMTVASARERMIVHYVQPEEYLTAIANRYRSTVCAIVLANELDNPDLILAGQELLIPVLP